MRPVRRKTTEVSCCIWLHRVLKRNHGCMELWRHSNGMKQMLAVHRQKPYRLGAFIDGPYDRKKRAELSVWIWTRRCGTVSIRCGGGMTRRKKRLGTHHTVLRSVRKLRWAQNPAWNRPGRIPVGAALLNAMRALSLKKDVTDASVIIVMNRQRA